MGWNTSALFVRDRSSEDVLGFLPDVLEYTPTGEEVAAESAWAGSPGQRLHLSDEGDWCQLWDPDQRFPPRVGLRIERDGPGTLQVTQALAVLFSSITSTYALWLYDEGTLVRHISFRDGEPAQVFGAVVADPLPAEVRAEIPSWGPDEDYLWNVIEAVTGLDNDLDQLFTVYDVAP
ncbi:hypothetical protein [Streptomyces sp. NPDC056069]|uniref:hypothetical protein n=1 Tax=Streptomyces sp. NPDC056069 TaxID=3345702 RepID=UPI0035D94E6F